MPIDVLNNVLNNLLRNADIDIIDDITITRVLNDNNVVVSVLSGFTPVGDITVTPSL